MAPGTEHDRTIPDKLARRHDFYAQREVVVAEERKDPVTLDFCSRAKIGVRLRDLRNEINLTQTSVAQMMGISNSALSQYESCKRVPDYELLCQLAQLYDVSTDYLLGITDFRLRFLDIKETQMEIQGIETLKRESPDLFQMMVTLCVTLDKKERNALTAITQAYIEHCEKEKSDAQEKRNRFHL